jgi:hypothetical protein
MLQKCFIDKYGIPENCSDSGATHIFNYFGGVGLSSFNNQMYMLNANYTPDDGSGDFISQCNIDSESGDLSNCNNANSLMPYLTSPNFLTISGETMYVFYTPGNTLDNSLYTECDTANDRFFCHPAQGNLFNHVQPLMMVLNSSNTIAYVSLNNNTIDMCDVSPEDGSISNCTNSGATNVNEVMRIWLDNYNSIAYIWNKGSSSDPITVCSILATGSLSNCSTSISGTLLQGLGAYGEPLYFDKYINRLVFFGSRGYTTIGQLDNTAVFSQQPNSDGSLNQNKNEGVLTSILVY